jgi:hypothetical protein
MVKLGREEHIIKRPGVTPQTKEVSYGCKGGRCRQIFTGRSPIVCTLVVVEPGGRAVKVRRRGRENCGTGKGTVLGGLHCGWRIFMPVIV